jgi:hypothetical protein
MARDSYSEQCERGGVRTFSTNDRIASLMIGSDAEVG